MALLRAIIIVFLPLCVVYSNGRKLHPLSDEFINLINEKQNSWRAGRNFHRNTSLSYIKGLMGTLKDNHFIRLPHPSHGFEKRTTVPKTFDARNKWRGCPTLNDIRDQGSCGSCWAVSAVSAMTDRYCINSNGTRHFYFSDEDVLSCCTKCGPGCSGGVLAMAWLFYNETGIVSGGHFGSKQGCMPYQIPPCEHDVPGQREECTTVVTTPSCHKRCKTGYKLKYYQDKHRSKQVYQVSRKRGIKSEILRFGPITASFKVYEDFLHYKSGVYIHKEGSYIGDHSVKIIGWGVEKKIKYWLAANSWNTDWGNNGFFKILRDKNHCDIESNMVAGI